ncbi:MAG TPA: nicotinate phosphoribosyltransferase [Frankiaceae bacterium]|jgi:nicotinate phosphoribosyltransferase|nr:nicotinate phosphoribosyltransferase [Frankiaceae bacterium]
MSSTALLTDHYELTMLQAALESGAAFKPAVFEVFTRRLPPGRRYGVFAGVGRLLDAFDAFRFGPAEIDLLRETNVVNEATAAWLAEHLAARPRVDVTGLAEGEAYGPGTPVLVVEGTFGHAVLLETLVLSILNHDSAVAAAGARMTGAAQDRPCIEMGSRRTHEQAAVAAARAAYIVGFAATSNLEASRRYEIPTTGTSAHAFTLAHETERAAFEAQVASLGTDTTLLVDSYDVMQGVRTAVEIAGPGLGAVRLDSGDLAVLAHEVRALLDSLGARGTRIIVTSDLDEYAIAALAAAPVDGYGVGTALATGSGAPTAGFVYKLVERSGVPVHKLSPGKLSRGGRKSLARRLNARGKAVEDVVVPGHDAPVGPHLRPLHERLVHDGERVADVSLAEARQRWVQSRAELPAQALRLSAGDPALKATFEGF